METIDSVMLAQIRDIDQRDEGQIMAELAGETLREYFYEVNHYDRRLKKKVRKVKLSWAGVREVARGRGNIVLDELIISEAGDHWRVVVKATDLVRNFTVFGGCHQPKQMKVSDIDEDNGEVKGDRIVDDPYALEKGISKAQRNALDKCIPADYTAKAIDRLLKLAGKPPLYAVAAPKTSKPRKTPRTKEAVEWDKVTREMLPDYPHLERLAWELAKLQPSELYRRLGTSSRNDMTITAWEAFLRLKKGFMDSRKAGVAVG